MKIILNNPAVLTMFTCADLTDEQLAIVRRIKANELYVKKDGEFVTELSDDVLYGNNAIVAYMRTLGYDEVPGCITEIDVIEILSLAEDWEQLKDFVFFIDRIKNRNECLEILDAPVEIMRDAAKLLNDAVEDFWFGNKEIFRDDGQTRRACLMDLR